MIHKILKLYSNFRHKIKALVFIVTEKLSTEIRSLELMHLIQLVLLTVEEKILQNHQYQKYKNRLNQIQIFK